MLGGAWLTRWAPTTTLPGVLLLSPPRDRLRQGRGEVTCSPLGSSRGRQGEACLPRSPRVLEGGGAGSLGPGGEQRLGSLFSYSLRWPPRARGLRVGGPGSALGVLRSSHTLCSASDLLCDLHKFLSLSGSQPGLLKAERLNDTVCH